MLLPLLQNNLLSGDGIIISAPVVVVTATPVAATVSGSGTATIAGVPVVVTATPIAATIIRPPSNRTRVLFLSDRAAVADAIERWAEFLSDRAAT